MENFTGEVVIGQRWLSDTQSELGLGIVTAIEGRCIRINYPATGETRLYALAEAPLTRVVLAIGERVRDRAGQQLRVTGIRTSGGLLTYDCETLDGSSCELPEAELDDRLRLNRPRQRLLAGRVDADHWFHLRYHTWQQGMREASSPTLGLLGARVALIPHQLGLAAEVAERAAPRVLLADEVGLGKTIEAGLIVHRMLLTGRAQRVLIVTPEPLLHQWLVEMRRRFNLRFALFDDERVDMTNADSNPFLDEQQVLCSLDVLLASPAIKRAVLAGQWDVLVVDEAHHLGWSETAVSPEYALIAGLAECTPGVLLLTATPEQLGRAGHFGRLRLLDPARFHSLTAFEAEAAGYAPIAVLAARLLDDEPLTAADHALLESLDKSSFFDKSPQPPFAKGGLSASPPLEKGGQGGISNLIEQLLDRHGTGRVLFRNTRAAVAGFPQRQLLAYPLIEKSPQPPFAKGGLSASPPLEKGGQGGISNLIEQLLDRHGTGRVLFRNTRAAVAGFPQRQLLAYPLIEKSPQPPFAKGGLSESFAKGGLEDSPSLEKERLETPPLEKGGAGGISSKVKGGLGEISEHDPRIDWLIATLRELRPAKVLLICAHAKTVLALREELFRRAG
ncbi:SNF2-related protein, partial [Chromatium okenii]|uniref:SNF2-related protein n=1 Tax=Chromatium okenii TaxID=61644 RepID=UPI0026EF6B8A